MNNELLKKIIALQQDELTEHYIYEKLSKAIKDKHNKSIIEIISRDNLRHYDILKKYTQRDVSSHVLKMWIYYGIMKMFGITFGMKLMERREHKAHILYAELKSSIPEIIKIEEEENEHERLLINMINEERLQYVGSIILGLNDALVELTGALAGFTLALQNGRLITIAGLITGISGALSMAASEYLSLKTEKQKLNPISGAFYTGSAYIITVFLLLMPYFFISNYYAALGLTLFIGLCIITVFTSYIAIAQDITFRKRFFEMVIISFGIASVTFVIGIMSRILFDIEM